MVSKILEKDWGRLRSEKDRDHSDHSIVKISYNTQESLGDLRKLAIAQTRVKKDKFRQVWQKARRMGTQWDLESPVTIKPHKLLESFLVIYQA